MSIRYTDLCKQMQKTAAVLLSSSVILQSCSGELSNHNMKGAKRNAPSVKLEASQQEDTITNIDSKSVDGSAVPESGASKGKASSKWGYVAAFGAGLVVAGVPIGVGLGVTYNNTKNDLNNANNQLSALQTQLNAANSTNSALLNQVSGLQTTVNTYLGPTSALMTDLNTIASSLSSSFTVSTGNSTGARLLTDGSGRLLPSVNSNILSDISSLSKVTSVNIPGTPIVPYTSQGANILNSTNIALAGTSCTSTPSTTTPITNAVNTALMQFEPASIAATAASSVTYGTAGTPTAIITAMQAVLPTNAQTTDPGYLAAQAASLVSGATMNSVLTAVINAAGTSAPSSIAATAAASITKASSYPTYPYGAMTPSSLAISNAVSTTVGPTAAVLAAGNAITSMASTATPASILAAVNNALGISNTWAQYGFLVTPTTNQAVINGFVSSYGVTSSHASIASAMNAVGTVSTANSPYVFNASNLLSAINYATGNSQSTGWSTYTSSDTSPASYAAATTAISSYGSAYTANANAVVAGMSAGSPLLLANTVSSSITASNPVAISANQASLVPGATCTTVNNAVLTGLAQSQALYVHPDPDKIYTVGKMMEYQKYFSNLNSISIIGKTLSYPISWDLTVLPYLSNFSLNGSVVNNVITLPKNLSNLNIFNSTKCPGAMILSSATGANFSSPGFTNTTVDAAATTFNMQAGTGPLCPSNIGSIPTTGLFPTVMTYSNMYNTCEANLLSARNQMGGFRNMTYTAISSQINATNQYLNASNYYNACMSTLGTCTAAFAPYVVNQNTENVIMATACTVTV